MGKLIKALRLIAIIPDVIDFITSAVEALKDRELTPGEIAQLANKGAGILDALNNRS